MTEAREQGVEEGTSNPSCLVPAMQSRLVPYALGRDEGAYAEEFEAHLLLCEACFADLKSIDRTQELIREFLKTEGPEVKAARLVVARRRWRRRLLIGILLLGAAALGFAAGIAW